MNPQTQSPSVSSSAAVSTPVDTKAHINEATAFLRKVEDLAREGNSLGALALEEIARNLGASCANKFGRPSELGFMGYMLAMQHRNLSIGARTQLAMVANKAALAPSPERKPVFKLKGEASSLAGGYSFKLNLPTAVEAAISG